MPDVFSLPFQWFRAPLAARVKYIPVLVIVAAAKPSSARVLPHPGEAGVEWRQNKLATPALRALVTTRTKFIYEFEQLSRACALHLGAISFRSSAKVDDYRSVF